MNQQEAINLIPGIQEARFKAICKKLFNFIPDDFTEDQVNQIARVRNEMGKMQTVDYSKVIAALRESGALPKAEVKEPEVSEVKPMNASQPSASDEEPKQPSALATASTSEAMDQASAAAKKEKQQILADTMSGEYQTLEEQYKVKALTRAAFYAGRRPKNAEVAKKFDAAAQAAIDYHKGLSESFTTAPEELLIPTGAKLPNQGQLNDPLADALFDEAEEDQDLFSKAKQPQLTTH